MNSVLLIKAEQPTDESLISVGTVYGDTVTLNLAYWEYFRVGVGMPWYASPQS